jgi:hypothetical protein
MVSIFQIMKSIESIKTVSESSESNLVVSKSAVVADFSRIVNMDESSKDNQIAEIENEHQRERKDRRKERFLWVLICMVLADALILRDFNSIGSIIIGVIEIIFVVVFAEMCEIENIYTIITNISDVAAKLRGAAGGKAERTEPGGKE